MTPSSRGSRGSPLPRGEKLSSLTSRRRVLYRDPREEAKVRLLPRGESQAPGRVYTQRLRCDLCGYEQTVGHSGPNYEKRPGVHGPIERRCPNCKSLLVRGHR